MREKLIFLVHPALMLAHGNLVQMLSEGLREIAVDHQVAHALPPEPAPRAIVLGANFFNADDLSALPANSIILNIENSSSAFITSDYLALLRKYHVWDYDRNNAEALSRAVFRPVRHLKMFYVESLSRIPAADEEDIDVLFFGSFNDRRQAVLDGLRERGLSVTAIYGVFGDELNKLIARSKVVLNVHFYENGRLEMLRLFDLLANRRAIVTEANPGEAVDEDLAGAFIAVPYSDLVVETEALVHDPQRRRRLAVAGFKAFSRRRADTVLSEAMEDLEKMPDETTYGIPADDSPAAASNTNIPDLQGEDYLEVLGRIHSVLKPRNYLEIGTYTGNSLARAACPSIAIDFTFKISSDVIGTKPQCLFFQCTSDDFFKHHSPKTYFGDTLDFAFIDGLHLFEFALREFINLELHCSRNSLIVIHDCVPTDVYIATRGNTPEDMQASSRPGWWAGDVWKVPLILRKYRPDLRVVVLDAHPTGLVLVTNLCPQSLTLSEKYFDIVDEFGNITLLEYGLSKFIAEMNLVDTRSLQQLHDFGPTFWL